MNSRALQRGFAVALSTLLVLSLLAMTVGFAGTAAAQSQQADVVFIFDKTGSMDQQADALQSEVENVAEELDAAGVDAQYALVTYESQYNTEVRQELTSDTDALKSELDFNTEGGTEDASDAILYSFDNLDFRSDSQKIFIVITDEDDDSSDATRQAAIQRLNDEGATLVAVSPEEADSGYSEEESLRNMAEEQADNGAWTDVFSESFTDVVTDIVEVVKEETEPTSPGKTTSFDVVEKSVDKKTVYAGETFNATLVVEATGSGEYHALVTDLSNRHYSERVDMDHGETERFEIPLSYDEPGSYTLKINHRILERVTVEERPLDDEDVDVQDVSVARSTVAPGETYEVSATVENVGDESGDASVEFSVGTNGSNSTQAVTTQMTELSAGETATVTYEATAEHNGSQSETETLTWAVDNESTNVTLMSEDALETGVIDAHTSSGADSTTDVVGVIYNADDEPRLVAVNFASEEGQSGSLKLVEVAPGETVDVSMSVEPSGDEDSVWWINGEPTSEAPADDE